MSEQAKLNGTPIVYLGGLPPATEEDILHAAQGEAPLLKAGLIGHGPVRGTYEQFLESLDKTAHAASFLHSLQTRDPRPSWVDPERYARAYEEKIAVGVALVGSLDPEDRKKILQEIQEAPFYRSFQPQVKEIEDRVAAQEKA